MILNDEMQSQIGYELEQASMSEIHDGPVPVSASLEDIELIARIVELRSIDTDKVKYQPTWAD
jgi:hypothetical protein